MYDISIGVVWVSFLEYFKEYLLELVGVVVDVYKWIKVMIIGMNDWLLILLWIRIRVLFFVFMII